MVLVCAVEWVCVCASCWFHEGVEFVVLVVEEGWFVVSVFEYGDALGVNFVWYVVTPCGPKCADSFGLCYVSSVNGGIGNWYEVV